MRELVFQVEFLSDIVLPASSNTEGNIASLDFIPGSNFLGMVAKNYDNFSNSFDVFHSGKVRFGDATLLSKEGKELYKMPFSFFHPKLEEHRVFHHHFLAEKQRKELGQLKQMRSGYIFADMGKSLKVENINYNYAQKSAYDTTKRRSKTSSMYGYRAIEAETKWQFVVKCDDSLKDDISLIKETLENSKRLGKSKSAQYGQIKIKYIKEQECSTIKIPKSGEEVILYAKSRIALVDDNGNATYDLDYLLKDIKIDYPKCQIRTSTFTPYDRTMQTKTYERLVIEKGSVIVLKSLTEEQRIKIESGVGLYLAEGFGELLVNPPFLMQSEEIKLFEKSNTESKKDQRETIDEASKSGDTVQFLINRHNGEFKRLTLADRVRNFKNDNPIYKNISNSQWGTIRSICTSGVEGFRKDIEEYISDGKEAWSSDQIEKLLDKENDLEFIKLLAIEMPKEERGEHDDK